ncbi:hypothetical protein [Rhizorhabdus histidinilytica]|uniref:hypothetical protein n=1 Tax=Rhizorhabdus histidinilytica TaxID=439228 RepID=UPI00321FFD69
MSNALIVPPVAFATVTASGSAPGHDPADVGNDYMGVVWKSPAGSSASLTVDLGTDTSCDTAFLFGCDGATPAMTLKVEASTDAAGSSFAAPSWSGAALPFLAGSEMPVNGRGVALWQAPDGAAPPPARYWRFTIGGLAGGQAVVARIVLGRNLGLERNFGFGAPFGVKDLGSVDWNRMGVMLRKRGRKLRTLGLTYKALHRDEVEAAWLPMIETIGNTEMLAILTDPAADAMRQRRFYFGPCFGDLSAIWQRADGFTAGFNLVSVI